LYSVGLTILCRCQESVLNQEDERFPVLLPTAEACDTAENKDDCPEKEEELGIFQVMKRLEDVTNMLTSR